MFVAGRLYLNHTVADAVVQQLSYICGSVGRLLIPVSNGRRPDPATRSEPPKRAASLSTRGFLSRVRSATYRAANGRAQAVSSEHISRPRRGAICSQPVPLLYQETYGPAHLLDPRSGRRRPWPGCAYARRASGRMARYRRRRNRTSDLLTLDDLGLHRLTTQQSADLYELILNRHRASSFVITSNRAVDEWLSLFDDPILGNSALNRLSNASYQIVIEGTSYRERLSPHRALLETRR